MSAAAAAQVSPPALLGKAEDLLVARKLRAALQMYQSAAAHGADPDRCAAGRWMVHMLRGEFHAAWRESDAIRARGTGGGDCLWGGEDIRGKRLMVRCLHGFGDAVQFMRYAPRLNALAREVIWQVPPALLELAPCFIGVERIVTWRADTRDEPAWDVQAEVPAWDVQAEIMELPSILRTHIAELPIATRYLRLPDAVISATAAEMGPRSVPRVGVVWAGGDWNPSRSIPGYLLRGILATGGCEFWNLQGGPERELQGCGMLRDERPCSSGILALASVISQLDLVITVDTLAAHLAGALGRPAWVMLQHEADWRWLVNRSDSPWYPSLRLFRQERAGDWRPVLESLEEALYEWRNGKAVQRAA